MKKFIITILTLVFIINLANAQDKYFTRTGKISFYSEAPIENIEAHNNQSTCILDASNGEMAFSVQMRGFEFEKALMQEHFNENYIESAKFPKATFKGKITNFEKLDLSDEGKFNVNVKGKLTIHGVTQDVSSDGILDFKQGKIGVLSTFQVAVADYDISIPAAVVDNIAKIIDIKVELDLEPYNN